MLRRALAVSTLVLIVAMPALSWAVGAQEPTGATRVVAGLKEPVDFAFGRDGYVYFASLTKREIHRLHYDTGEIDEGFAVTFEGATWEQYTETGLFGLALHPDFALNGILYASYSSNESGTWSNVLSRVTLKDGSGRATEEVLMTRPGGRFHNGGRVMVADGHLWWTTGDATDPWSGEPKVIGRVAQEDGVMRGKILRLTLDGRPAADNAWGDAAFTKGHRNVYGIAYDDEKDRVLITENGNAKSDELNILASGGDFGWPDCEGFCKGPHPGSIEPIYATNGTVAPTGAAFFRGAFWFGTFNQGDVLRVSDASGAWEVKKVHHYGGTAKLPPRVLDLEVAPDGSGLWFSSWDELWRLDFGPASDPKEAVVAGPYWWEGAEADPVATGPEDAPAGNIPSPGPALALLVLTLCLRSLRQRA